MILIADNSLGIRLSAKKGGLLPSVSPSLQKLRDSRIYISLDVITAVLELAGVPN